MPSMANITVKNAANTDVVYVAAVPSAGDRTPAKWTANALSSIVGFRPHVTVQTRDGGSGKPGRVMEGVFKFPVIETDTNGRPTQTAIVPGNFSITLPTNVDQAVVNDAYVQFGNLLTSALMRAVASDGYAPT